MTTTELQAKIEALQAAFDTKVQEQNAYRSQIDALKKQLTDLNKPKLTMAQFDELTESVEYGIGNFDFSDTDNYSIDFGLDYDGRVHCESLEFDNADELAREICEKVYEMFGEANEDNNQENQD
tara:strand:- start:214 stop:585 length:372 start_codon:yes stop_codon:yes gene_type:complete